VPTKCKTARDGKLYSTASPATEKAQLPNRAQQEQQWKMWIQSSTARRKTTYSRQHEPNIHAIFPSRSLKREESGGGGWQADMPETIISDLQETLENRKKHQSI